MTIDSYMRLHAHGFSGSDESNLHPAYEGGELFSLSIRRGADVTCIYTDARQGWKSVGSPAASELIAIRARMASIHAFQVDMTIVPVALTPQARVGLSAHPLKVFRFNPYTRSFTMLSNNCLRSE